MKGAKGFSGFEIWHCIVWSLVVPAIYVAMASSTPAQVCTRMAESWMGACRVFHPLQVFT